MDTRLNHLLALYRERKRDVIRYVRDRWPEGRIIRFEHHGLSWEGRVLRHDVGDERVVVAVDNYTIRVSYPCIKEPR